MCLRCETHNPNGWVCLCISNSNENVLKHMISYINYINRGVCCRTLNFRTRILQNSHNFNNLLILGIHNLTIPNNFIMTHNSQVICYKYTKYLLICTM